MGSPLFCNCPAGGEHADCAAKCTPLVIRPVPLPRPVTPTSTGRDRSDLFPIHRLTTSNPCTCRDILLKPALLPKIVVPEVWCERHSRFDCDCQRQRTPPVNSGGPINCNVGEGGVNTIQSDNSAALADAVSIAVANQMARKACRLQENHLSFGFRILPQEAPILIARNDHVAEEGLTHIHGDVLELAKVACGGPTLEEEAAEELLLAAELAETAAEEGATVRRLTFGDLGYGPASSHRHWSKFAPVPDGSLRCAGDTLTTTDTSSSSVKQCNDGFKPGHVTIRHTSDVEPIMSVPCDVTPHCGANDNSSGDEDFEGSPSTGCSTARGDCNKNKNRWMDNY